MSPRPDKNWRLISYPYYTKYTIDGEYTGFSHLDLNIKDFVESGKGANIVQGGLMKPAKIAQVSYSGSKSTLTNGTPICWHAGRAMLVTGETTDCRNLYSPADR